MLVALLPLLATGLEYVLVEVLDVEPYVLASASALLEGPVPPKRPLPDRMPLPRPLVVPELEAERPWVLRRLGMRDTVVRVLPLLPVLPPVPPR